MRRRWINNALQAIGRRLHWVAAWLEARAEPRLGAPEPDTNPGFDPGASEPPPHWLALVRARAPGFVLRAGRARIVSPPSSLPAGNDTPAAVEPPPDRDVRQPAAAEPAKSRPTSSVQPAPATRTHAPAADSQTTAPPSPAPRIASPAPRPTEEAGSRRPFVPALPEPPESRSAFPRDHAPSAQPHKPIRIRREQPALDEDGPDERVVSSPAPGLPVSAQGPTPRPPTGHDAEHGYLRERAPDSPPAPPSGAGLVPAPAPDQGRVIVARREGAAAEGEGQRPPPGWPPMVGRTVSRVQWTAQDQDTARPSRAAPAPEDETEADPWPELPEMEWAQWHDDPTTILREENRRRRLKAEQAGFSWSELLS